MRFVHAADIHLDSPLRNLALHEGAPVEQMRLATRAAFERLVDFCIEQQAAFLILAGDLYDHDCPNMQIAVFLRNQLARLGKAGIRVIIKKGNHDADNRITSGLGLPENTRIFRDDRPESIPLDGLPVPVAIHGQSFRPGPVRENLAAGYPAPLPGHLNIGVLHTSLGGYPGEHAEYAPCTLTDLTTRGYAYWALGHIHKGTVLARQPCWVVYPGNIQGRHAKETGPKGCVVVELEDDRIVSVSPVALDVIRWHHVTVDLQGASREPDLLERMRSGLTQARRDADGRPSAIRLTMTGRTPLHAEIERRPNRLRQHALELAGEIAGDDIWIEKIRNDCSPPAGTTNGTPNEAAAELVTLMKEIAGNTAQVGPLLEKELTLLRAKLPEGFKELPALALLQDPGLARDMLARLEPRIAARLAGEDDA